VEGCAVKFTLKHPSATLLPAIEVVERSIGSDLHMDYTAVGQTTHLAARMEQMAMPDSILITTDVLRLAEGYVQVKALGPVPVKGVHAPVGVSKVLGAGAVRQERTLHRGPCRTHHGDRDVPVGGDDLLAARSGGGTGAGGGAVMDFYTVLDQIVDLLRRRGRVPYRALQRQLPLERGDFTTGAPPIGRGRVAVPTGSAAPGDLPL
jgi:Adenylate and Guanylate cyclase catalytic domain